MAIAKQNTATTTSIPAPIGGWNARDSLANMPVTDAVTLTNFFPTPTDVQLRNGYQTWSTGITGQVNTLMTYNSPSNEQMFACAGTKIYNCTNKGTATTAYSSITNDKLQFTNVSNVGGYYLSAVNGVDAPLLYDGANWIKIANTTTAQTISSITEGGTGNLTATVTTASAHGLVTGNQVVISGATPTQYNGAYVITVTGTTTFTYKMATTPGSNATTVGSYTVLGITGVDPTTFVNVNLYQNRLYYCANNSLKVYYLGINAIAGAANYVDLGGIARNGGYVQAMGTWTIDGGYGVNDYAVFVTNMGEVIVYQGSDPSDSTNWALVGVWQLGFVFNRRCFYKWGSDMLILMQDGLVPLSATLQSDRLNPRVFLTDKISREINQEIDLYSNNFGWQIIYFAKETMLLINVPDSNGTQQFVMNTITKAWANFTNIPVTCWNLLYEEMYCGGDGVVYQFWSGNSDNGSNIIGNAQQAYSYFDKPGQLKRFTLIRPIIQSDNGIPAVLCNINVDFDTQVPTGQLSFNPALLNVGTWDSGKWDVQNWGGGYVTTKVWQGVQGIGFAASVNMAVASQGIDFHWASTDYVMESGGVL